MTASAITKNVLELHNVHKSVATKNGEIHILQGVDLALQQGRSIAILGESGSGKSTLLALCAGLDLPQQGQISMQGRDITQLNEDERAQLRADSTGFVFQSFYLLPELTALENIALPLELFGHAHAEQTAQEWLEKLGMSERSNHLPNQLSGGEQQRVALCRAFAVQPTILFADEPTANLDQQTASKVIDHLFNLQRENHSSMLLVTHDTALAQRCDVVYQLTAGQLHVQH